MDIWGGDARYRGAHPWQRDTIVNVYSTTKTMAATCMLMLADRGELDFDAPVARYWPEFAPQRQGRRAVCAPRDGPPPPACPASTPPITVEQLYDPRPRRGQPRGPVPVVGAGAPPPATHAVSQGNLQGEILPPASPGGAWPTWFRTEVAEPLGADFWMSLPATEDPSGGRAAAARCSAADRLTINGVEVSADSIAVKALLSCPQTAPRAGHPRVAGPRRSPPRGGPRQRPGA